MKNIVTTVMSMDYDKSVLYNLRRAAYCGCKDAPTEVFRLLAMTNSSLSDKNVSAIGLTAKLVLKGLADIGNRSSRFGCFLGEIIERNILSPNRVKADLDILSTISSVNPVVNMINKYVDIAISNNIKLSPIDIAYIISHVDNKELHARDCFRVMCDVCSKTDKI